MKHSLTRRDECTHQISAKLTSDAFEIYKEWRHRRRGGREISNAIVSYSRAKANLERETAENEEELLRRRGENIKMSYKIQEMEKNIAALQKIITRTFGERDELAAELSEMYCPKRPE